MSIQGNLTYTECNAEMAESRAMEEITITKKEDARVNSLSFTSVDADPRQHKFLELDHATRNLQNILLKKELESKRSRSEDRNLDCPNIDTFRCTNKIRNENFCLKPKNEIMSLPLSSLKVDEKSNGLLLNLTPTLKVESKSNPKTDLIRDIKLTLYAEENTSIVPYESLAQEEELISTGSRPSSKCSEIDYQTDSTASASNELGIKYLNPVVVLKRLSFPGIGSSQSKQYSVRTRNEGDQHSQEIRYSNNYFLFECNLSFFSHNSLTLSSEFVNNFDQLHELYIIYSFF